MNKESHNQIYENLKTKETDALLEIWENWDVDEGDENEIDAVEEILFDRLQHELPTSIETRLRESLNRINENLQSGELNKALIECEIAIQMKTELAMAHNYRGVFFDDIGQLEFAILDFSAAIQIEPELEDAWVNLLSVEKNIEDEFIKSSTKQHLDQALEYLLDDEPEKASEACELAQTMMPPIAVAYNYLGMIWEELQQLESAINAYLEAIRLNPRFYPARKNLRNARLRWELEQYRHVAEDYQNEGDEEKDILLEFDDGQVSESWERAGPIPGWLYLDRSAFLLSGWAGHRTRPGRSGYDPLDTNFELAHIQGTIIRLLITRKFRTRNPIYLLMMTYAGIVFSSPLFIIIALFQGNWNGFPVLIITSPYWVIGVALLLNVFLSFRSGKKVEDSKSYTFF